MLALLGWADAKQRRTGAGRPGRRSGLQAIWAQTKTGRHRVEGRKKKETSFIFLKILQTNEFKCKFEFEHTKPMHQHVCNIKVL
jgi:hypothetical protein